MIRTCHKCHEPKDEEEFYLHGGRPNGRRAECKSCTKANNAAYRRSARGAKFHKEYAQTRKAENMKRVLEYLMEHPCVDCGETNLLALEFDHVGEVEMRVTTLLNRTWKVILEEIQRCEVRCATCHSIVTHSRANSLRYRLCKEFSFGEQV